MLMVNMGRDIPGTEQNTGPLSLTIWFNIGEMLIVPSMLYRVNGITFKINAGFGRTWKMWF